MALVYRVGCGFLVTLGGYRHLDGLEQLLVVEEELVIILLL
jgi:hypothetical protein